MNAILPPNLDRFLRHAGWSGAEVVPLAGDASFRRYFRLRRGGVTAMLMHAPPPMEDPRPFLAVAEWLRAQRFRAPQVLAALPEEGLVLLEDFGETRMREYVEAWPEDESEIYGHAIDTLARLAQVPAGPFPAYSLDELLREVRLFTEWYCPAQGLVVDGAGWVAAWRAVLAPLVEALVQPVTVLRDYHAENVMLLGRLDAQGLLDFQDALAGHPAYDLVSLLQDARRDVSPALEVAMFDRFCEAVRPDGDFLADYARLGAQRNAKIIGIFVRLWQRDHKPRYLGLIPRVWAHFERDLVHPALAPVAHWMDANIPPAWREPSGPLGGPFAIETR